MAITDKSVLEAASTVYRSLAAEIFNNTPGGIFREFTEELSVDSKVNTFNILGAFPAIREWAGEKYFKDARAYSVSATVKAFEKSFLLPRLDGSLDRTGLIANSLRKFLADANQSSYDKLSHEELIANRTCYDGVALFHASHPHGPAGATQSNTSSTALSFAQHDAVMQAGMALRDSESEPLGIAYDTLIVGPRLMKLAMEITGSAERVIGINAAGVEATSSVVAAAAIPNVFGGGQMRLIVDPRLVGTYDDYYYYLDTQKSAKPLIMGVARGLEAVTQESMDSEGRFLHDQLRFSVEADLCFAPGAWQVAFAGIVS